MKQHELFKNIYASNLKSRAVNVMSCLITYMNANDNTCFPSIKMIAKCCSISVNTVKRALDDLVSARFVEKEARFIEKKNGAQTSNLYRLSAVFTEPEPPKEDNPVADRGDKEYEVITFGDLKAECEPSTPVQEQSADTLVAPAFSKRVTVTNRVGRAISELRCTVGIISASVQKAVRLAQFPCIPP